MFNASTALNVNRAELRVEPDDEQDRLDILNKNRTSVMPWRGQFSPELIEYLIESNCSAGSFIFDPFCGSGTVLYEAARLGSEAYAIDINPAAICLARFSRVCEASKIERNTAIAEFRELSSDLCRISEHSEDALVGAVHAVRALSEREGNGVVSSVLKAGLLLAFGNQSATSKKKLLNAQKAIEVAIENAPVTKKTLKCEVGDARRTCLEDESVDYVVTSPPYINVFNYHQNYRPIVEAMDFAPLPMARAEIGANRKHRQNRYMTVVQYCIDMALFLNEAQRVLKKGAPLTIVLGRESNVRGVAFRNGEIIGAIASEGLGWAVSSWRERKFLNRFGDTIVEDVLTLYPTNFTSLESEVIGRAVGTEALRNALGYAPKDRTQEIEAAIAISEKIFPSPYVLEEVEKKDG